MFRGRIGRVSSKVITRVITLVSSLLEVPTSAIQLLLALALFVLVVVEGRVKCVQTDMIIEKNNTKH